MAHSVAVPAVEAPGAPKIDIEEYLRTEYRPDVEYVDGELKEKPVVGFAHGEVQIILGDWFRRHRKEWGIRVAVETRTRVKKNRVRLPDVVVVRADQRVKNTLQTAPLIAIEVLSDTDTYAELRNRAADLRAMGTENVWLIDPDQRTAEVWNGQSWIPHEGTMLQAVNSPMHVDLVWVWAELDS